jgi:hypothetical protein
MLHCPDLQEAMLASGFRYALLLPGLDGLPLYVLRGVPEVLAARAGREVRVRGTEESRDNAGRYAVLRVREVIDGAR